MASNFSGRYTQPLGGSRHAGGGLWENLPVELMSPSVSHTHFVDYQSDSDIEYYVTTNITSGTVDIVTATANGILRLNNTAINEGLGSVQYTDAAAMSAGIAAPLAGRDIAAEFRVACDDIDDCDWFVGLGEVDTTFMTLAGALAANGADNCIGFHHTIADAGVPILTACGTALANIQTSRAAGGITPLGPATSALADDTHYRLGLRIQGTGLVRFYIDDIPASDWVTLTAALAEPMTITYCMISNASAINFDVDYAIVTATR